MIGVEPLFATAAGGFSLLLGVLVLVTTANQRAGRVVDPTAEDAPADEAELESEPEAPPAA